MADPPTHFFKFVSPGFLFNLSIPSSFLTKLENGKRCFKAILRRGSTHKWSVDIEEGVFGDGWRRFVKENGVQEFDFIVLKHQGNMVFDFMVFDQSTCEKHYPDLFVEMEGEEPVTVTESDTICTHRPEKLKKRKRNDYVSEDVEKIQDGDDRGCFVSTMTPYVINKSRLHVPRKFARSNGLITQRIHTQVYLMDDKQRSWPATLHQGKLQLCLTGWHEFIVNNHLKAGDVCRCELVKHGEVPVFKCSRKNFVKKHIKVKETSSSLNNHPYFISYLTPTSLKRSVLYLPANFPIQNGLKIGEMILIDNKGRSWKVQLNKLKRNQFYIGGGFRAFLAANGLKKGDKIKFELVEKEKGKHPIVNLFLLKSKPVLKTKLPVLKSKRTKSRKEAKLPRKEGSILGEEDASPYFVGAIKSASIKQSRLYLPLEFAKQNGLINEKKMTLKNVKDGSSWTVQIKNHKHRYSYIGPGWKEFRVANGLKEGDHFKFELVNNGEKPIANFHLQKSVEATKRPRQNKSGKRLKKARLDVASSSDASLVNNESEVPTGAIKKDRGHRRSVGHKLKSVSTDHQPPPQTPTNDMWSKKKCEKKMSKLCDKIYEGFNASLQALQEQQARFFQSHLSDYKPSPLIQINRDPNLFLEDEDDE